MSTTNDDQYIAAVQEIKDVLREHGVSQYWIINSATSKLSKEARRALANALIPAVTKARFLAHSSGRVFWSIRHISNWLTKEQENGS